MTTTKPETEAALSIEVDERMKALAAVYQTADSVIAGERVTVSVGRWTKTMAPAWTTGTGIFINADKVDTRDLEDIVRMHGLNFHELAHVLYSPRAGTVLMQWAMDEHHMPALNILEDQRIESMLTLRYPSTAPWLTAAVLRWVMEDPKAWDRGYMFVRGRRYLPGKLRGVMRAGFCAPALLPRIDAAIDTYRRLVFPTDYDAAKACVKEMTAILREINVSDLSDPNGHTVCPHHVADTGRPVGVKEQRQLRDRMAPPPEAPGPEAGAEPPTDSQDSPNGKDGSTESSPPADGQSMPMGDLNGSDGTEPSSSPGAGNGEESARPQSRDMDALEDMLDQVLSDPEVLQDFRKTQRIIAEAVGAEVIKRSTAIRNDPPMPDFALMSHQLARSLDRLREEAEPGWERRVDSGRLNVVRWATDRDPEEAFDSWNDGVADAVSIEAVVMLDASGSMGQVKEFANNAMWVLKRAFDHVDISSTVIVYDVTSEILYGNDEQATTLVRSAWDKGRGTEPTMGLQQAARILAGSRKSQKLLIVLTDGEWHYGEDEFGWTADAYINRMNESGVVTALGYMHTTPCYDDQFKQIPPTQEVILQAVAQNRHDCRIAAPADGHNLVPFIANIVTDMIRTKILVSR